MKITETPAVNKHIGKMAAKAPRKEIANLQALLPQEIYRSRYFANMPPVMGKLMNEIAK